MCAKVTSTYMEFTLAFGPKPEFSFSFKLLKKEYPEIREKLWKEAFWSQSFCLLTAGGASVEVIGQYIETQGEKKH